MTQQELAQRLGMTKEFINNLIKGHNAITAETSIQLEKVTGVPSEFWNNLESNYRERLARLNEEKKLATQTQWLKQFSWSQMVKLKFVEPASSDVEKVDLLLRFFGVASPDQWSGTYKKLQGAAREAAKWKSELGDFSAWIRAGEVIAQQRECQPYDAKRFQVNLLTIRKLTQEPPVNAWPKVCKLCADAGVVVVLVPELPNTHVAGFTRWLTPSKALIQLSLRYKTDDNLWFTFFHEAAHILLHGKKDVFIEYRENDSPKETEANEWAAKTLIRQTDWSAYCSTLSKPVSAQRIHAFAQEQKIAASIVVGRLQKEKWVPYNHHQKLKHRLGIAWKGLANKT